MAILQTDILIKTAIETALADLRRNPWILRDVFGGLSCDGFAKDQMSVVEYGQKEVDAAIKWFLGTNILVLLPFRTDAPEFPAITIVRGPSQERLDRTSLGDDGSVVDFDRGNISQTPQQVLRQFTPTSYDPATGVITLPTGFNTDGVASGQYLVSSRSGKTHEIIKVLSKRAFAIAAAADDFTDAYVIPSTSAWNLHREHTFFNETFFIGCHAQSDPVQCMWLHAVVVYSLLRYKEAYLEGRGFEVSTFSSDQMIQNPHFQPEMVFTRTISLSGQVEASWVKFIAPRLQKVSGRVVVLDAPRTPSTYTKQANDDEGIYMEGDIRHLKGFVPGIGSDDD